MPRPTDQSDEPSTLPQAELNPLMNPILGQNMGRWAEVYFTTPPERREQAVLELVKELEAESAARGESAAASPAAEHSSDSEISPVLERVPAPALVTRCHACGRRNPESQRFCGMCGARLEDSGPTTAGLSALLTSDLPEIDLPELDMPEIDRGIDTPLPIGCEPVGGDSEPLSPVLSVTDPLPPANNFPRFRTMGDTAPDDENLDDSDPASDASVNRLYIAAAIAFVIIALVYMVWRSTQFTPNASRAIPQTERAVAKQTEPPSSAAPVPPPQAAASVVASNNPRTPDSTPESSETPASQAQDKAANTEPSGTPASAVATPPEPSPAGNGSSVNGSLGSGSQELATAQAYLNGTNGQQRDAVEAAKWLWKAIAKHNDEATLLLSDLYLKGDGVSKNCDQARVLLDAAARKGIKGAGDRLRNLAAFGCQ